MRSVTQYRVEQLEGQMRNMDTKLDTIHSEIKTFKGFMVAISIVGGVVMTFAPILLKYMLGV